MATGSKLRHSAQGHRVARKLVAACPLWLTPQQVYEQLSLFLISLSTKKRYACVSVMQKQRREETASEMTTSDDFFISRKEPSTQSLDLKVESPQVGRWTGSAFHNNLVYSQPPAASDVHTPGDPGQVLTSTRS